MTERAPMPKFNKRTNQPGALKRRPGAQYYTVTLTLGDAHRAPHVQWKFKTKTEAGTFYADMGEAGYRLTDKQKGE